LGVESAAAVAGVLYVLGGAYGLLDDAGRFPVAVWLVTAIAVCGAAAWRWGYPLAAGLAAVFAFALLARTPVGVGRLLWVAAGPAVAVVALQAARSARLPPSLRTCADAVAGVALLALYGAVHLGSWDGSLVEFFTGGRVLSHEIRDGAMRTAATLGTALVPMAVLLAGILLRRTLLLRIGLLLLLASVATLRAYVHVMPLWLALGLGGAVAIAAALGVRRLLHEGRNRERGGFTAEPLFEGGRRGALEVAAVVASMSPPAAAPAPAPGLETGGGRFGGGGASGTY
jgi:hypothetical protein